jgi:hypothetical protein
MSREDRTEAIRLLEESAVRLATAVRDVNEEQARFRPGGGDEWCIAQCVHHLALTERGILEDLREKVKHPPADPNRVADLVKDQLIRERVPTRARKVSAPEHFHPSRSTPLPQALAEFEAVRRESLEFARTEGAELRLYVRDHFALKTLDGYQWLLLMASHAQRHSAQIEEIKSHPDYPATPKTIGLP